MMIAGQNYGSYRHALAGVESYKWEDLPPLTDRQKQDVATIVDGFKTKEDVQAWANANGKTADPLVFAAVVGAADQRKLIDMTASLGIKDSLRSQGIMVSKSEVEKSEIPSIIATADGYAATLIAAGVLTQVDYDAQKATAKGADWTVVSATAFRAAVKKALDDYNAAKPPAAESSGMGWLLPVGIAAAAFLALRK